MHLSNKSWKVVILGFAQSVYVRVKLWGNELFYVLNGMYASEY